MVAGATGSGKTIALNNLILSLLYRNSPAQLRFILVDPKRVEFPVYNDLPHLLTPVILDIQRTINALKWLTKEMERRFLVFAKARVRDIKSYHALHAQEPIPYIVLIIDELADLMATRGKEIESMIVRLAQMARAVGIHLVLATQRPSVEVITGLIKANITSRIALQVASQIDSRTILDGAGAEKLLGLGDMLFLSAEFGKPKRIQGAYISDKEVKRVVGWIAKENQDVVTEEIEEDELAQSAQNGLEVSEFEGDEDPLYEEAKRVVMEYQKASASLLQRRLRVGYARAARLLDLLEQQKVIGRGDGAKAREVYVAREKSPLELLEQESTESPEEGKEDSRWFTP
jgi:S-DNA-T family DNA segregation ATPase FtsK/SpoIIIE